MKRTTCLANAKATCKQCLVALVTQARYTHTAEPSLLLTTGKGSENIAFSWTSWFKKDAQDSAKWPFLGTTWRLCCNQSTFCMNLHGEIEATLSTSKDSCTEEDQMMRLLRSSISQRTRFLRMPALPLWKSLQRAASWHKDCDAIWLRARGERHAAGRWYVRAYGRIPVNCGYLRARPGQHVHIRPVKVST